MQNDHRSQHALPLWKQAKTFLSVETSSHCPRPSQLCNQHALFLTCKSSSSQSLHTYSWEHRRGWWGQEMESRVRSQVWSLRPWVAVLVEMVPLWASGESSSIQSVIRHSTLGCDGSVLLLVRALGRSQAHTGYTAWNGVTSQFMERISFRSVCRNI